MLENSMTVFFILLDVFLGVGLLLFLVSVFAIGTEKEQPQDFEKEILEHNIDILQEENERLKEENERFKKV